LYKEDDMAGIFGSGLSHISNLLGGFEGATDWNSYWGNVGQGYVNDWNNMTGFFSDPLGALDSWMNPQPEMRGAESANQWNTMAMDRADTLGGSAQDYLTQGTQGVDNVDTAQMNAAQMKKYAQMEAAGFNPEQFMQQWQGAQGAIANAAMSASQPFGAALNQVAQRQAALGSEAALAAMPGAANSGAGMAAFGQAYADPFAQAQVQQQGMMGNIYGNLSGQAMGQYGSNAQFGAGLQQQANQFNAANQQDMLRTNAGFMQDANMQNAGWRQQSAMQNQMMQNAMRERMMQAGNINQNAALGWGNIGAGLAADQSYLYQPISPLDMFLNMGGTAAQFGSMFAGM
jgi:hypothetical protein